MTTYSVAELSQIVGRAVSRALPDEIWVRGEIRDLNRAPSGHVYFSLVDGDVSDGPPALLPVTLFSSDKVAVNRVLQRSGAVRMTDGVEVRIRGRVAHYAARGTVQLRMTWIDTEYTLGRLAAERERLIRSLEQRGLLAKNRSLPLPLVPLHIGLVTSRGSAAEADFLDELRGSSYAWRVVSVDSRMQGRDAAADVVAALGLLAARGVDAIALVRGGGAQTDLAAFDDEAIAVAVANAPIPVLTGIGHEIDMSVADLVARSHKTPTACAAALVALVRSYLDGLDRIALATERAAQRRLETARVDLSSSTSRLDRSAGSAATRSSYRLDVLASRSLRASQGLLRRRQEGLDQVAERIARTGAVRLAAAADSLDRMTVAMEGVAGRSLTSAQNHLNDLQHRIGLSDPDRLLARGWSITRSQNGTVITDPAEVEPGSRLRTTVAGGELASVVVEESKNG